MIVKKIVLVASAAALMSSPAWALPGHAPSNRATRHAPGTIPAGPPSTTPNNTDNPGTADRSPAAGHATENGADSKGRGHGSDSQGKHGSSNPNKPSHPSHPGQSNKCKTHAVAYIASGTLAGQALVKNTDGSYSGSVTVNVTHTNRHAAGDKGTQSYTLTDARVTFGLADINHDGSVGLDDLQTGDRVRAIGKITTLAKKCNQTGFASTTTIHKVTFHKS
jgi:hypothetical protein